ARRSQRQASRASDLLRAGPEGPAYEFAGPEGPAYGPAYGAGLRSGLLATGGRRDEALQPEIGHQIAVVLVVVADLADQRVRPRHLARAERRLHHAAERRVGCRGERAVAIGDGVGRRLENLGAGLRVLLEVVLGERRLLPLRRGAEDVAGAGLVGQDLAEAAHVGGRLEAVV